MEDPDECYAVMLEARAGLAFAVLGAPDQEPQVCLVPGSAPALHFSHIQAEDVLQYGRHFAG